MIERRGALLDAGDRPRRAPLGSSRTVRVGDLQKVGALHPSGYFDVALINGVFGWGLDTLDGQNEAVEGLARVLKPAGILMLGWNTDRSSDPTKLLAIERFFVPSQRSGVERRIVVPGVTHVYDFLSRNNS